MEKHLDKIVTTLLVSIVTILLFCTTGCAPLLGIKSYETNESRTEFITGYDFGLSAKGVDTVENNRGIRPEHNNFRKVAKNQNLE